MFCLLFHSHKSFLGPLINTIHPWGTGHTPPLKHFHLPLSGRVKFIIVSKVLCPCFPDSLETSLLNHCLPLPLLFHFSEEPLFSSANSHSQLNIQQNHFLRKSFLSSSDSQRGLTALYGSSYLPSAWFQFIVCSLKL